MLKSITLQNYKCFSKETQIELTPLTILTGVNNSGKTTILNSLNLKPQLPSLAEIRNCFRISPHQKEAVELSKLFDIPLNSIDCIDVEMRYTQPNHFADIKPFPSIDGKTYTVSFRGEFKNDDFEKELEILCTTSDVVGSLYSKVKHVEANRECTKMPNISASMKKWMKRMELGSLDSADTRYVLPILMAGTQLQQGQTLIVENPEIFLHPKNQLKLADFFISLVKTGHQIIIETHSDHIINRVLRRVLECKTTSLLNSTTIYFLQKQSIEQMSIDRVQGISKCPNDFFKQFADETRHIFNAGLDNIGKVETSIEQISIDRRLGITKAPDDFFGQFADETGKIVSAGLSNIRNGK